MRPSSASWLTQNRASLSAIAGNWSAKLEYLYVDLGEISCAGCFGASNVDFRTHVVRAGLNWRF